MLLKDFVEVGSFEIKGATIGRVHVKCSAINCISQEWISSGLNVTAAPKHPKISCKKMCNQPLLFIQPHFLQLPPLEPPWNTTIKNTIKPAIEHCLITFNPLNQPLNPPQFWHCSIQSHFRNAFELGGASASVLFYIN